MSNYGHSTRLNEIIVHPSDTLDKIAKRFNIPKKYFIRANNLKAPYKLKPGCLLRYPPVHIVKKNETTEAILKKYKLNEDLLMGHNDLKKPYILKEGQILYLSRTPIKTPIAQKKQATAQKKQALITSKKETPAPSKKIIIPPSTKTISTVIKVTPPETKAPQPKKTFIAPAKSNSNFCWPIEKKAPIICPYGLLSEGKRNDGLNIRASKGTIVLASQEGEVVYVGDNLKNYGLLILIKHAQNFHTTYAHLDKSFVKTGQKVKKGQKIALSGASGNVDTPQLHFEIRHASKPINPQIYLNKS